MAYCCSCFRSCIIGTQAGKLSNRRTTFRRFQLCQLSEWHPCPAQHSFCDASTNHKPSRNGHVQVSLLFICSSGDGSSNIYFMPVHVFLSNIDFWIHVVKPWCPCRGARSTGGFPFWWDLFSLVPNSTPLRIANSLCLRYVVCVTNCLVEITIVLLVVSFGLE